MGKVRLVGRICWFNIKCAGMMISMIMCLPIIFVYPPFLFVFMDIAEEYEDEADAIVEDMDEWEGR